MEGEDNRTDDAAPVAGERPKIFSNINGWIGGITGVVIALAGLRAAYQQLAPDDPAPQAIAAQATQTPTAHEPAAIEEEAPAEEAPYYYDLRSGGGLEFANGLWVETNAEGEETGRFEQLSDDGDTTVAVASDRSTGVYLRWRTYGGTLQRSEDHQGNWQDIDTVIVPPADEPAAQ